MSLPDLSTLPAWVKFFITALGGGAASITVGFLALRQWLSSAKVDRKADAATINTIDTLQEQLADERKRNSELTSERDKLVGEIGQLRGEVAGLRAEVASQKLQIETLLRLVQGLRAGGVA